MVSTWRRYRQHTGVKLLCYVLTVYVILWAMFVMTEHPMWNVHRVSRNNADGRSGRVNFNWSAYSSSVTKYNMASTNGHIAKGNKSKVRNKSHVKTKYKTETDSLNHTATKKYFGNKGASLDYFVNRHQFKFTLLPRTCADHVDFAILVHTALKHYQKRQLLRKSIFAKWDERFTFALVFLIGQTTNVDVLMDGVKKESNQYDDIVQGNFLDSYQNLTYKHIMGYHWIVNYCKHAKYVIKIDDDVIVNIQNVFQYVVNKTVPDGYIACSAYRKSKIKKTGKWSRLQNQFPFARYPPYCSGFAYLAPTSVVETLYNASSSVRFFWIDDVYVTGLLTLTAGIHLQGLTKTQAYKHLEKTPIPAEILKKALFIFHDPEYKIQS